jgi:hypothetical protein
MAKKKKKAKKKRASKYEKKLKLHSSFEFAVKTLVSMPTLIDKKKEK